VYVHAKVGIGDDRWLTLGSANLNAHSFFSDSEVNVVTCAAASGRPAAEQPPRRNPGEPLTQRADEAAGNLKRFRAAARPCAGAPGDG